MDDPDQIDDETGAGDEETQPEEERGHSGVLTGVVIGGVVGSIIGGLIGGKSDAEQGGGSSDTTFDEGEAGTTFTGPRISPDKIEEG